jgi:CRP-like cAMP-binding protein
MDTEKLKFVLEELNFSSALPSTTLNHLAEASTAQHVPAGAVLFREGGPNDNLYLVRSGRIALEMSVPGRGAVRILTIGPGGMAGWSALLDPRKKMTTSAVALEDSEVVAAPAGRLLALCEADHEFGFHLMRQMAGSLSKRLVATRLQLLDLFSHTPSEVPSSQSEASG